MKRRGRGGSFPENEDLPGNGLLQSGPRGKVQEKDVHVEAKKLTYWLVYGGKISIIVIPKKVDIIVSGSVPTKSQEV